MAWTIRLRTHPYAPTLDIHGWVPRQMTYHKTCRHGGCFRRLAIGSSAVYCNKHKQGNTMNGYTEAEEMAEYRKQVRRATKLLKSAYRQIWRRDFLLLELRPLVGENAQKMIDACLESGAETACTLPVEKVLI